MWPKPEWFGYEWLKFIDINIWWWLKLNLLSSRKSILFVFKHVQCVQFTFDWFKVVRHCIVYCAHLFFFYQSVGHISRCISWSEATAMFVMCTHWSFLPCFSLHSVFCCCILCVRLVGAFILFLFIRSFPFAISVIKVVHKIFVRETIIRFSKKKCTKVCNYQSTAKWAHREGKKAAHRIDKSKSVRCFFRNLPTNY